MSPIAYKDFHLSLADQTTVRVYVQKVLFFPFPDGNQEEALRVLEAGLRVTLAKFPFLAGTLSLADAGRLALRYPLDITDAHMAEIFQRKMITDYEHTYAALKELGLPMSACDSKWFLPDVLRNNPGVPPLGEGITNFKGNSMPALAIQASFIPGGLVLSVYNHHSVMDGTGTNTFMKYFADSVNQSRNDELLSRKALPDQSIMRKKLDARAVPAYEGAFGAYTTQTYKYTKTLDDKALCSVKLFVIPASRLRNYRDKLVNAGVETTTRMTVCNVLSALLWTHITRARGEDLKGTEHRMTRVGIAVNWRQRQEPALDDSYMGNMAHFAVAEKSIGRLVSEKHVTNQTIIPVVQAVNDGISNVNNEWVQQLLNFQASNTTFVDTECALGFRFGPDMYITSWMHMGADIEWNIPGTSSSTPEFIRRVHSGPASDGGIIIMPRSRKVVDGKEAPYEVMIRLAKKHMDKLINEGEGLATRWAEKVLD